MEEERGISSRGKRMETITRYRKGRRRKMSNVKYEEEKERNDEERKNNENGKKEKWEVKRKNNEYEISRIITINRIIGMRKKRLKLRRRGIEQITRKIGGRKRNRRCGRKIIKIREMKERVQRRKEKNEEKDTKKDGKRRASE